MIKMKDNLYEVRKWIFEDFMKDGYKFIARDKDGAIFAYSNKPTKRENAWILDRVESFDIYQNISLVSRIFTDIEWENVEPFRIPYTDWKEVTVDTPVVYTSGIDNGKTYVLHFCRYDKEKDRVILYAEGRTSFTEKGIIETYPERVTIYKQGEKLNDGNISDNND